MGWLIRSRRLLSAILLSGFSHCYLSDKAFADPPNPLVNLRVLWEINEGQNGATDYTTTTQTSERDSYPFLGAIAYIRADQSANPLYRLSSNTDHVDSTTQTISGYSLNGTLGSPWASSSAVAGLSEITRIYSNQNGDNATTSPNFSSLVQSQYGGYSSVGTLGYGYQRYANLGPNLLYYSAGGITEGSDFVAGGAVASWTWNGAQFVNSHDYGRYMQSDMFYTDSSGTTYNPIEAGDSISGVGQPGTWHGSPVLVNQITNGVHMTLAIPLEYGLSEVGVTGFPVSAESPSIYPTMRIGKNLTLNFNNLGPVGQYNVIVQSPTALSSMKLEAPSIYINSGFDTFFTYDAVNGTLTNVNPGNGCSGAPGISYYPPSKSGGVIISDSSQTHAIGIYRRVGAKGASTLFQMFDFAQCFDGPKKIVATLNGALPSGTSIFPSYIVSGTVSQVASLMSTLFQQSY